MKKSQRKPFSEMSRAEQIAEARASIERLQHPHNRYSTNCQDAVRRWQDWLRSVGVQNMYEV